MGVDTFAGSFGFMSHHQINAHFVCTGRIKLGTEGVSAFMRCMAKVFGDTVCKELDLQRPRSDLQRAEER